MKKQYDVQSQNTMSQWPIMVKRPDQIPECFVEVLDTEFGASWPYSIFIPSSKWDADGRRPKVFSMTEKGIAYFEDLKSEVRQIFYPYEDILYVEIGRMLLSSWMTVHGMVRGQYRQSTVSYNTVRDDLFDPIIEEIRRKISPEQVVEDIQGSESEMKEMDYKFINYTKQALLPGEKIINIIYQPGMLESERMNLGELPEHTHAVVLTDNELILIKEDNHRYKNIHSNYGVIKDFIPLTHIRDMVSESLMAGLKMHVNIEDKEDLKRSFAAEQSGRLSQMIGIFKSLKQ